MKSEAVIKSVAIELDAGGVAAATPAVRARELTIRERLAAYLELTKPRITFLIVLTAAAGFCLGAKGGLDYVRFAHAMFGIALLSSGIATLNQYIERRFDAQPAEEDVAGGLHQPLSGDHPLAVVVEMAGA